MTALDPPKELSYEPLGTVPATMHQQRCKPIKSGKKVECPFCGSLKGPGSIVTEQGPKWDITRECLVGVRSTYCDHCDKRLVWFEQFIGKKPTGEVLDGPYSASGNLDKYLAAYPQVQGVEQS